MLLLASRTHASHPGSEERQAAAVKIGSEDRTRSDGGGSHDEEDTDEEVEKIRKEGQRIDRMELPGWVFREG